MSENPFRVASDGFLAVLNFYGHDVVTFGVSDLLQEAFLEVCEEVFWVLFSVGMQQVSEQWVVGACCSVSDAHQYAVFGSLSFGKLLAHLSRKPLPLRQHRLLCTFEQS